MNLVEAGEVFRSYPKLCHTLDNSLKNLLSRLTEDNLDEMIEYNSRFPYDETDPEIIYMRMLLLALYQATLVPVEVNVEILPRSNPNNN